MIGRREFGLMVAACATKLGCGRGDESKPSDPFAPDARALLEFSPPSTIELVDPGVEPRERLRYAERAPSRRVELGSWMPKFCDSPQLSFIVTWTGVEAKGETRRYTYEVIGIEGEQAQAGRDHSDWRMLAGQALGTSAGLDRVIQTRGISASPNPGEFIESFAVTLPVEAIGLGAVWTRTHETRSEMAVAGSGQAEVLIVTTTRRYTLIERRGDLLTIDLATRTVTDKPQRVPGEVTGSGRLVVALSDPLPQSGGFEVISSVDSFGVPEDPERSQSMIRTRE